MTTPTAPIELTGHGSRLGDEPGPLPRSLLDRLDALERSGQCTVQRDVANTAEAGRDWWPLALHWALAGEVPRRAAAVVRPSTTEAVAGILDACETTRTPVTAAGGRSGVCGASIPLFGGVVLDMTAFDQVGEIDAVSGVVEVGAGTFGPDLERELRSRAGMTVGHHPQSFELATVGGWVACRGAGQYSTRYGKIEDMVVGLEVVLADGRVVRTGGAPAAAVGPDLSQVFIGSEGTLGVVTRVWLRAHPVPSAERRAAYWFGSLGDGFEACRRIVRTGATPAVLRLYDAIESARSHGGDGTECALLVLDEADERLLDTTMHIVDDVATSLGRAGDVGLVDRWTEHRNDTSALQGLTRKGFVVDTMEVAAPWSRLGAVHAAATEALRGVRHARSASCHLSHSYVDGACLYFSFAATPPPDEIESTYIEMWDAGQRAVLAAGGNLSHHHGVGLNRGRFMADALGTAHSVIIDLKRSLDPNGILNPGKLGIPSAFGAPSWP